MSNLSFEQEQKNTSKTHNHLLWAVIIVGITAFICLVLGILTINRFSSTVHPLLSSRQELYAYFREHQLLKDDFAIINAVLGSSFVQEEDDSVLILGELMDNFRVNTGFFIEKSKLFFFVEQANCENQQQLQDFILERSYSLIDVDIDGACYLVFSKEGQLSEIHFDAENTLKTKLALYLNDKNQDKTGLFVRSMPKNGALIGIIDSSSDLLQVQFGWSEADFGQPLISQATEAALYRFKQVRTSTFSPLFFPQEVRSLAKFSDLSGEFFIYRGGLREFSENMYASGQSWSWKGGENTANTVKTRILSDLADKYPIAVEQTLPDDTISIELEENPDSFLGSRINEEGNEEDLFTYPDGQITMLSKNEMTIIEKDSPQTDEIIENRCVYPEAIGSGEVESSFFGINLWRSAQFSYDQRKMIICFIKNT